MRLANDIAAAAMDHCKLVVEAGMARGGDRRGMGGFVHGEGTGVGGEGRPCAGLLAHWSGPGIRTFTATTSRPSSSTSRRCSRSGSAPTAAGATTRRTSWSAASPVYRELEQGAHGRLRDAIDFAQPGALLAELDRRVPEEHRCARIRGSAPHPICHGVGARAHEHRTPIRPEAERSRPGWFLQSNQDAI